MKNYGNYYDDEGIQREGFQVVETSSNVYDSRSINTEIDWKCEPNRRMMAAWAAFAEVSKATVEPADQNPSYQSARIDSSSSGLLRSEDESRHRCDI
ncbi:hypothetical protein RB195_016272 [Necator americanus]|uniref:Uncharacterized protein n=1 Tax=Necator americanus TaxID=51031 RepID=A0ABR1E8H2_NECAM